MHANQGWENVAQMKSVFLQMMDIPAGASQVMKGKIMNAKNLVRFGEFFYMSLMILLKFLSK